MTLVPWGSWERGRDLDDLGDLDARSECLCVGEVGGVGVNISSNSTNKC